MTANENPAISDGAIDGPATQTNQDYSNADNSRRRLELGERAGKYLDGMCDAIASGRVELWQLPLPIASIYLLGHEHGRQSRNSELEALNWEASYWHFRASNPRTEWHRFAELELWRQGVAA